MIYASDLHSSSKAPVARQREEDWLGVQARYFRWLGKVSRLWDESDPVPIAVAGDFFHVWNSSAELINMMIASMPKVYGIPGQHDLPNHSYEDIKKTSYWTLVEAGVIIHVEDKIVVGSGDRQIVLHGFPWKRPVVPCDRKQRPDAIHVALVHAYIWTPGNGFTGAANERRVLSVRKDLDGYDAAVYGDNHKGFYWTDGNCCVLNCGGFQRRHSDQIDYQPMIGLHVDRHTIVRFPVPVSKDVIDVVEEKEPVEGRDTSRFVGSLKELGSEEYDFRDGAVHHMDRKGTSDGTRNKVLSCVEVTE